MQKFLHEDIITSGMSLGADTLAWFAFDKMKGGIFVLWQGDIGHDFA